MTQMDPITILFGNPAKVKLLRYFLFNPNKIDTFDEISKRSKLVRRTARTEMNILEKANIVKKRTIHEQVGDEKIEQEGYFLNKAFPYLNPLRTFMFETAPINGKTVLQHLRTAGHIDFLVVAGVFVDQYEQRLDVMVALKKYDEESVKKSMRSLEAELGLDIRFTAMSTDDLIYRISMNDRLVRDVLDYDHIVVVDKASIENEIMTY